MKNILLIVALCCSGSILLAQKNVSIQPGFTSYADTANYLIHEIEMKKNLFIGKPFSVLYDSLKIKPVDIIAGSSNKEYFGKHPMFKFNYEFEFEKSHYIVVKFEFVPSYEVLFPLFFPNPGGAFGKIEDILPLYIPLIVKDISVKDYTQDDPRQPGITDNSNL